MSEVIRKITIGDNTYGLSYQKDQTFNRGKSTEIRVTRIVLDKEYLLKFGVDKYDIFAVGHEGKEKIWKSVSRQKVMIEFEF